MKVRAILIGSLTEEQAKKTKEFLDKTFNTDVSVNIEKFCKDELMVVFSE